MRRILINYVQYSYIVYIWTSILYMNNHIVKPMFSGGLFNMVFCFSGFESTEMSWCFLIHLYHSSSFVSAASRDYIGA